MIIDPLGKIPNERLDVVPVKKGGTGGTTAEKARRNLDVMHRAWLYDNSAGTTGTITLSDSIDNYPFIEIFHNSGSISGSINISTKNSSLFVTVSNINPTSGFMYVEAKKILVQGATISVLSHTHAGIENGTTYTNGGGNISITRVIGYCY